MTTRKFKNEVYTLHSFLETYCSHKHKNKVQKNRDILYKDLQFSLTLNLCDECMEIFEYSLDKLQNCPHEDKPRCRKCSNPCYEKLYWKRLAKIMRYSGVKLGLLKIKRFFIN